MDSKVHVKVVLDVFCVADVGVNILDYINEHCNFEIEEDSPVGSVSIQSIDVEEIKIRDSR